VREIRIRVAAPSLVIVCEVEGPTRMLWASESNSELARVARWIEASEALRVLRYAAEIDTRADPLRGEAWRLWLALADPPDLRAIADAIGDGI